MIYVMIESEIDMAIHNRADMIIHKCINAQIAMENLFAYQKFGVSGLFCNLGSLALSQNQKRINELQ